MCKQFILFKFIISIIILLIDSCSYTNKKDEILMIKVGDKINLMEYAFKSSISDSSAFSFDPDSQYKIVVYANLYCEPCWNNILLWKENLKYFKDYPQVSFYCYVHCTPIDFKSKNAIDKLNFPVLFDSTGRFKIVNKISNNPREMTFLLNRENEVLLIGNPFSEEMREKYISVITMGNKN